MKLIDTLLLSLSAALLIIGIYEVMTLGLAHAYWMFMLIAICLLVYNFRKKNQRK